MFKYPNFTNLVQNSVRKIVNSESTFKLKTCENYNFGCLSANPKRIRV